MTSVRRSREVGRRIMSKTKTAFSLGKLVVTANVDANMKIQKIFKQFVLDSLEQYKRKDWGDSSKQEKLANEKALRGTPEEQARLVAKYNYNKSIAIYIITEWDRSVTTVLYAHEY